MKSMFAAFMVVAMSAGGVRADPLYTAYSGVYFDVIASDARVHAIASGVVVEFTLGVVGKDGFAPSSFDGVHRDGVVGGAAGVTGSLYRDGYDSRFLYDPAAAVVVDPTWLPGYIPDPAALTGLFALTGGGYPTTWDLAQIICPVGERVTLDFTIGHAGESTSEYVGASFVGLQIADANFDGTVDLDDFATLKSNFGTTGATWASGDFNGDGVVNLDDFALLKNNFGATAGP